MSGRRAAAPAPGWLGALLGAVRAWFTLERRGKLYRIVTAAALVAGVYGWATETELAAWLGFASALLGTGVAAANSPTKATQGGSRAG